MIWWHLRGENAYGWIVVPMPREAVREPVVWRYTTWMVQQRLGDDVRWSIKLRRRKM